MTWEDLGIYGVNENKAEQYVVCPTEECRSRKKNKEKKLFVNTIGNYYSCQHCGWKGKKFEKMEIKQMPPKVYAKPKLTKTALSDEYHQYWLGRGISSDILNRNKISSADESMPVGDGKWEKVPCMLFPYLQNGEVVNIKYRAKGKIFKMFKDAKLIPFGLDDVMDKKEFLLCEGEGDKMGWEVAGFKNCISVPNGATLQNNNLSWIDNCPEIFAKASKVFMCTDNDTAGKALRSDLAHRVGLEKCWTIEYPENCKDALEVLKNCDNGVQVLKDMIANAKPWPLHGVADVEETATDMYRYYLEGEVGGCKVGMGFFDVLASFQLGQLTIGTGLPNSGKGEFFDEIYLRLSILFGWKFAIFSPENWPLYYHLSKLIEKYEGEPLFSKHGKMDEMQMFYALDYILKNFFFIAPKQDQDLDMSIDGLIKVAKQLVLVKGINAFVIDPYNFVDHNYEGLSETQYISKFLSKLTNFAKRSNVHVFLIAHPFKLKKGSDGVWPIPTLYDIAGCHDEETEVLTNEGWKKHRDLNTNELVACFNMDTEELSYQKPTAYHKYPYKGELYNFKGRGMDIMVTPNHKMVISPYWDLKPEDGKNIGRTCKYKKRGWQLIDAKDVKMSPVKMPKGGKFNTISTIDTSSIVMLDGGYAAVLIFQLIGWYVSEGWETMGSIAMCQADQMSANLRKVVGDLHLEGDEKVTNYREHEKPMYKFRMYAKKHPELAKFIIDKCGIGSENKKLPILTWGASIALKHLLFDALIEGDGSISGRGYKYHTCSKQLADDVMRLSIELGMRATIGYSKSKNEKWKDRYVVYITHRLTECISPVNHKRQQYDGCVWCLTVPTSAYLTRRNGKVAVTGNSANFYNKADVGICIYRNFQKQEADVETEKEDVTSVIIEKIRHKGIGKRGVVNFNYDLKTGLFYQNNLPQGLKHLAAKKLNLRDISESINNQDDPNF